MQNIRHSFIVCTPPILAMVTLWSICTVPAFAQSGQIIPCAMSLTNNHGRTVSLTAGLHRLAGDSLDSMAGEQELPPVPPAELFDARFIGPTSKVYLGEGSLTDFRATRPDSSKFTENYRIKFQAGLDAPTVTLRMPAAWPYMITRIRVDGKTMKAGDSAVSAVATGDMNLAFDFDLTPMGFQIAPSAVSFRVSNKDVSLPAPVRVTITPGIAGATWYAVPSDSWIKLDRTIGAGTGDLLIGLDAFNFREGRTSGHVDIRTSPDGLATGIPVGVDMILGVMGAADATSFQLEKAYPQPARAGQSVRFGILLDGRRPVTCTIHDVLGRARRALLVNGTLGAGRTAIEWDLRDEDGNMLHPGLYFISVKSRDQQRAGTIIVQ